MDRDLVIRLAHAWHGLALSPADADRLAAELARFEAACTDSTVPYDTDPTIDYRRTLLAATHDGER